MIYTTALHVIIFHHQIHMPVRENRDVRFISPDSVFVFGLLLRLQGCLAQDERTAVVSHGNISFLITLDVQAGQGAYRDTGRHRGE